MNLLEIIIREFNEMRHDPSRAVLLLGAASAYLFLFGFLYGPGTIKNACGNQLPLPPQS